MSGLVTQDYQVEFDGLLMGPGTPFIFTNPKGFLDLSGTRASFTPRARAHGGFTEPHFGGGAVLDLEFDISSENFATFTAAVLALEANTYQQPTTRPLWFQYPGHGLRTMQVQCLRRSIPTTGQYFEGYVPKAALQFYAPDPLKYAPTQTLTTGLPTSGGGLTYPLAYPLNYGAAGNPGRVVATNTGSADVSPVLTITVPIDSAGFQVTSVEDGLTVQFNGAVGANDTFVIDTRTGISTLNGSTRYVTFTSWPKIPANSSRTFAFGALGAYSSLAALSVAFAPGFW